MKLSTNFVKDYVDIAVENEEELKKLAEDMTRVGNEYDSAKMLIPATKLVSPVLATNIVSARL